MKTGIALLNFGGPWTLRDVKPFLYRLFANPSVLVGVPAPLRQFIAFAIAQAKGPSSVECYKLIGGGSPQLAWTEEQAYGLRRLSDEQRAAFAIRRSICAEARRQVARVLSAAPASVDAAVAQRSRGVVAVGLSSGRRRRAAHRTNHRPGRRSLGRSAGGCDAAETT